MFLKNFCVSGHPESKNVTTVIVDWLWASTPFIIFLFKFMIKLYPEITKLLLILCKEGKSYL